MNYPWGHVITYTKQRDYILPCVCTVTVDHCRHQKCVKKHWHTLLPHVCQFVVLITFWCCLWIHVQKYKSDLCSCFLCRRFDLRFITIHDRFDREKYQVIRRNRIIFTCVGFFLANLGWEYKLKFPFFSIFNFIFKIVNFFYSIKCGLLFLCFSSLEKL